MKYVVVYEQTPNNWSAYVPDLPGCVAAGETRQETERLIREAISLHLEGLREDNDPMPAPGTWTGEVEVDIATSAGARPGSPPPRTRAKRRKKTAPATEKGQATP